MTTPKYLGIGKKQNAYVIKPRAGRHTLGRSIALSLLLRKLGMADTAKDAAKIIKTGNVLVNKKVVKDVKFPIGLSDIIEIPEAKKCISVSIDERAHIETKEKDSAEYGSQLFKVIGKYKTHDNQIMLRLHDGSVIKADKKVMVNDSVALNDKGAMGKVFSLQNGAKCFVINGVHVGTSGLVKSLVNGTIQTEASVLIKPEQGEEFETLVKNIMITG